MKVETPPFRRRRLELIIAVGLVITTGLASRSLPLFPSILGKYPGDALWALMVLLAIAIVRPGERPLRIALVALAASWLVEVSQLYQSPWINSLRATRLGHLALGSTFEILDLVAYAVGVLVGLTLDIGYFYRPLPKPQRPG